MTQIDAAAGLAAVIRRQVTSLARAGKAGGAASRARAGAARGPSDTGASGASGDIAELVARRVQAIDPDDPGRRRKAFRVFLESVLLAELGEDRLINDAGFYRLVDDVHAQMESDADLAQSMDAASAWLLEGSPASASRQRR
jgi:hypothetical protein